MDNIMVLLSLFGHENTRRKKQIKKSRGQFSENIRTKWTGFIILNCWQTGLICRRTGLICRRIKPVHRRIKPVRRRMKPVRQRIKTVHLVPIFCVPQLPQCGFHLQLQSEVACQRTKPVHLVLIFSQNWPLFFLICPFLLVFASTKNRTTPI